ncbi:MAG: hypothetical protein PHX30_03680 [Candidatus Pacebacteria bacterium]|nr:hypothetical protein [Candidatus Paceibacterota bacterium]
MPANTKPQVSAEVTEAPPTESPICDITATVRSIQKNINPNYYDIRIEITDINAVNDDDTSTCNKNYAAQIDRAGQILDIDDYPEQGMEENDNIETKVQFTSDGELSGYFLTEIQLIDRNDDEILNESESESQDQTENIPITETSDYKNDYFMSFIKAFSLLTIVILAFMVYASRDKLKKS